MPSQYISISNCLSIGWVWTYVGKAFQYIKIPAFFCAKYIVYKRIKLLVALHVMFQVVTPTCNKGLSENISVKLSKL